MRIDLPPLAPERGGQEPATKSGPMPLRSAWWRDVRRLQEATTQPYRSMMEGRDSGTEAVQRLQSALLFLRGRPNAVGRPYVFDIPSSEHSEESSRCVYGPFTRRAVAAFQEQTRLAADGIAGQTTLRHIDAALVTHYDTPLAPRRDPVSKVGGV